MVHRGGSRSDCCFVQPGCILPVLVFGLGRSSCVFESGAFSTVIGRGVRPGKPFGCGLLADCGTIG